MILPAEAHSSQPCADLSIAQFTHLLTNLLSNSLTARLDAQTLLAHLTGQRRAWLLAHPEAALTASQQQALAAAIAQIAAGVPLPYILGHWEFFGLEFIVTPDVLIPRPETEILVTEARRFLEARKIDSRPVLIDVGTGSGCIAVSLGASLPDLRGLATDLSTAALQVARANARKHGVEGRIQFIQADLLDFEINFRPLVITANLPYVPSAILPSLEIFGKEPTLALDGGPDGLSLISRLLPRAAQILAPAGLLLLEIEATQGQIALELAHQHFPAAQIDLHTDLSGHDRVIRIQTSTL